MRQLEGRVASFIIERGKKHVISVKADRQTSYEAYFAMQNSIVNAYGDVRDKMARREYNTSYTQCSQQQRDVIARKYPQRIAGAEATDDSRGRMTEEGGGE